MAHSMLLTIYPINALLTLTFTTEIFSSTETVAPAPDPERSTSESEQQRALAGALSHLAPEQRVLIEHAFFMGYTQSELAERFKLPLGTVKTRIRTGMLAMREHLQHVV